MQDKHKPVREIVQPAVIGSLYGRNFLRLITAVSSGRSLAVRTAVGLPRHREGWR